jgi:hypothetical protein
VGETKSNWTSLAVPKGTVFEILDESFKSKPNSVPALQESDTLIIGSDYSGESKDEPFLVYSFLLVGNKAWMSWEEQRIKLRNEIMPDARRMSYKKLGDRYRRKLLLPILKAADDLNGLSVSVAINKNCASLFSSNGPLDLKNPDFSAFLKWQSAVLEKAFTVLHFLGILIAGTAKKGQNIFWFTDQDAIAANNEMLTDLTKAFGWVSSQYLTFDLGHIRCGTTQCDNGSLQIEDFVAIPNLIAGALSEQFRASLSVGMRDDRYIWLTGPDMNEKATPITFWFGTSQKLLKKHLFIIDPSSDEKSHKVSWCNFTH